MSKPVGETDLFTLMGIERYELLGRDRMVSILRARDRGFIEAAVTGGLPSFEGGKKPLEKLTVDEIDAAVRGYLYSEEEPQTTFEMTIKEIFGGQQPGVAEMALLEAIWEIAQDTVRRHVEIFMNSPGRSFDSMQKKALRELLVYLDQKDRENDTLRPQISKGGTPIPFKR